MSQRLARIFVSAGSKRDHRREGPHRPTSARGGPLPGADGPLLAGALPAPEDDFELGEHFAWLVRELDAGRVQPPPESAIEAPAISISLGDACDVDPELLADVRPRWPWRAGGQLAFGQDKAADVLPPGPVLAALTAQAVAGEGSLVMKSLSARCRRLAGWRTMPPTRETVVIAEFARRRQAEFAAAKAAVPQLAAETGSSQARNWPWNWSPRGPTSAPASTRPLT